MPDLNRRRFVTLGATTAATALAGCLGGGGSGDAETYTDWIPATDGGTFIAYVDFTISQETSEINPVLPLILPNDGADESPGALAPDMSGLDDVDDPLLGLPLRTGGQIVGLATLSIAVAGLGYLLDPNRPASGITELFLVNGTAVGTGEIDVNRADEALRTGTAAVFGEIQFETVGEDGAYTLYEPTESGDAAVAVSERAVLVADAREDVQSALDAWRGDRERAVDADDAFASLLGAVDTGHMLVGWEGSVDFDQLTFRTGDSGPETDLVTPNDDVVASVSFAPAADELTADLEVRADDVPEDRLAEQLGSSSASRSLSVERDRVSATGTYTADVLDLEFVERGGTTTQTTTPPGGDDLPPEVAAAVPDGAFEFTYKADEDLVRVDFVEDVEADTVTIRAVESEYEVSTTTPNSGMYFNAYVDPEGDEVVVTVTVDGVTGTVARRDVP